MAAFGCALAIRCNARTLNVNVVVPALILVLCVGACRRAPDKEMEGAMGPSSAMGGGGAPVDAGGPGDGRGSPAPPSAGPGVDP
jgi:hypothetical protein